MTDRSRNLRKGYDTKGLLLHTMERTTITRNAAASPVLQEDSMTSHSVFRTKQVTSSYFSGQIYMLMGPYRDWASVRGNPLAQPSLFPGLRMRDWPAILASECSEGRTVFPLSIAQ